MAASESFDLRKYMIQCFHTKAHRIGVVDDPCIRRMIADRLGDLHIHRDRTERTHDPARSCGVSDRLVNTETFRHMYVHSHFVKCSRQDRKDDKIRAIQRRLNTVVRFVLPFSDSIFSCRHLISDDLVRFRRLFINVVQADRSSHIRLQRKVCHKSPRPTARSSSDIRDLHI